MAKSATVRFTFNDGSFLAWEIPAKEVNQFIVYDAIADLLSKYGIVYHSEEGQRLHLCVHDQ
jgi:hypothetical protein